MVAGRQEPQPCKYMKYIEKSPVIISHLRLDLLGELVEATSKSRLQRVLNLLKYVPDKPPTLPPVQTWTLGKGST